MKLERAEFANFIWEITLKRTKPVGSLKVAVFLKS